MKGDPKVIDYLNKALKHELAAVNQYWLHYRMLDDWGLTKLARHERTESIEEMQHADKLIARIIYLEGLPMMQTLDRLYIGKNTKNVLECDLKAEVSARTLYIEARDVCREAKDYVTMGLFESLLENEEEHIDFLETQLGLIDQIGEQNYAQLQSDAAGGGESGKD
jgi:bacterioferritin